MAPETQRFKQGEEMPTGGTAAGRECGTCGKRFTIMHYILTAWRCSACLEQEHRNAADAGRI